MKIEYFPPLGDEPAVLLIYGLEAGRVARLNELVNRLAAGSLDRVALHEVEGFEGVDGCQLFLLAGSADLGVRLVDAPYAFAFQCTFRPLSWLQISELLGPFYVNPRPNTFQWLDDFSDSPIALCISVDRGW